jgi:2-aminoadipate transaminase
MTVFAPVFANRTANVNPSVIRELLKVAARPDIISFAGGMPAPELTPAADLLKAACAAFSTDALAHAALQYGQSEGYMPLREWIKEDLLREEIAVPVEQILITTGSQQGIDLLAKAFIDPGDPVVVANPTFLGALQAFNAVEASYIPIDCDDEGILSGPLEAALAQRRPKLIYLNPVFQNPTGQSMSPMRMHQVYNLARDYGVPILEDDPYGELYFGTQRPKPMKSLDQDGLVMLLRTFSKTIAPGLRVAYAVLHPEILRRVVPLKQSADLHTSAFNQVMVHHYLTVADYDSHLSRLRTTYKRRYNVMKRAIDACFPKSVTTTEPDGGLFIWVRLPETLSAAPILDAALNEKVAFIPGQAFFAHHQGANTMRLNFSNATEARIEEGISRLGAVLETQALLVSQSV